MIIKETVLLAADNSGAKEIRCIGIPGKGGKKSAGVGDIITVSVISANTGDKIKVKKGEVHRAVVTSTKFRITEKNGIQTRFSVNSAVLITRSSKYNNISLLGTRIVLPISNQLRKNFAFNEIMSNAKEVY